MLRTTQRVHQPAVLKLEFGRNGHSRLSSVWITVVLVEIKQGRVLACLKLMVVRANPDKLNTCGVDCCPSQGIWGEWVTTMACNDTCGSCGVTTRSRKCLSLQYGCGCTGSATDSQPCASTVCLFPRASCCTGYKKMIDMASKTFYCGPLPVDTFTPEQTTCCDPENIGLWNSWGAWTACNATCGGCGMQTRSRTCASEAYGCPCTEAKVETKSCGKASCGGATPCCTGKFLATGYDGQQYCQDNTPQVCPGTWTEWSVVSGAKCNDTCGNCGFINRYRFCFPSGCQCDGAYTGQGPCANSVCLFPRASCCSPYKKMIDIPSKTFYCG
uniref:ShKT domain-containing protein n=1 Tax=Caenorhabditis tropicalis TaxID=1561998 RepID=A0A1I7U0A7_9PELO